MTSKLVPAAVAATVALTLVPASARSGGANEAPASAPAGRFGTWGIDLAGMDRSVRPGEDFFRFVNGKWAQSTHDSPGQDPLRRLRGPPRPLGGAGPRDPRPLGRRPFARAGLRRGEGRRDVPHLPRREEGRGARPPPDRRPARRDPGGPDPRRRRAADGAHQLRPRALPLRPGRLRRPEEPRALRALPLAGRSRAGRPRVLPPRRLQAAEGALPEVRRRHPAPRGVGRAGGESRCRRRPRDADRRGALDARREPRPRQDLQPDDRRRAGGGRPRVPLEALLRRGGAGRGRARGRPPGHGLPEAREDLGGDAGRDARRRGRRSTSPTRRRRSSRRPTPTFTGSSARSS